MAFFFFYSSVELCSQMWAFHYSCLRVWTHKETEVPSLCRNKAGMLEGLLLLDHRSNQLRFKWNSVRVTDMIFFFLNRHTRYHYISSWDNCSLSKVCYFPGGNPLPDCGFSMFNISHYSPKATNCVIDNVLITIHKRYKTAKTRKLSAWSGVCMFEKTHSVVVLVWNVYIFFPASAKNSNSKYEIALKEIITLIETIVPGRTINEIRSP